eukprot:UN06883
MVGYCGRQETKNKNRLQFPKKSSTCVLSDNQPHVLHSQERVSLLVFNLIFDKMKHNS